MKKEEHPYVNKIIIFAHIVFSRMRKIICLILCLLTTFLTFGQGIQPRNGDLLFVGLPMDYNIKNDTSSMDAAITQATGKEGETNYIHVAILEVDHAGKIWVIDATLKHGVDRHPIDTFLSDFALKDGSLPLLNVLRLKNNRHAADYVENAKRFCGLPYDIYFLPDNDARYCSELVRDAYITPKGRHIFKTVPMNFKAADGTFPIYWVRLFKQINQPIPQDVPGTNPNDMSKSKRLKRIGTLSLTR